MKRVGTFITGLLVGATLFGGTAAYAAGIIAEQRTDHRIVQLLSPGRILYGGLGRLLRRRFPLYWVLYSCNVIFPKGEIPVSAAVQIQGFSLENCQRIEETDSENWKAVGTAWLHGIGAVRPCHTEHWFCRTNMRANIYDQADLLHHKRKAKAVKPSLIYYQLEFIVKFKNQEMYV